MATTDEDSVAIVAGGGEGQEPADELYRLLVASVRDYAIFALDDQGRVVTWNPGAETLKGYRANEIIGRHFSAFYPDEDVARGKPAHELAIASEYGRYEDEGWRIRADGSRFWANVVITAMRLPGGRLVGFSKVTRDLTERRRAEQSLRQAYRDLEAFSYTVSHDLRAPLRSIIALAEAALTEPLTTEARTHLTSVMRSAQEGADLTENLLRFAHASAGELRDEPVDLIALAREIAGRLRESATHPVTFDVDDKKEMHVRGDRALLRIALENLLSNAWKFTRGRENARVEFMVEQDGDGAPVYVVRDNGAGFDAANARSLFQPFQRFHAQVEFPGSGVGLATVQRIIRRHAGRVWAEGEPGRGARFYFTLHRR